MEHTRCCCHYGKKIFFLTDSDGTVSLICLGYKCHCSSLQLAIVAIIFNVFRTIKVDKLLGKLLENPDIYADFEFLAFWQMQYNNMNAVNLFFAWIKVNTSCFNSAGLL